MYRVIDDSHHSEPVAEEPIANDLPQAEPIVEEPVQEEAVSSEPAQQEALKEPEQDIPHEEVNDRDDQPEEPEVIIEEHENPARAEL